MNSIRSSVRNPSVKIAVFFIAAMAMLLSRAQAMPAYAGFEKVFGYKAEERPKNLFGATHRIERALGECLLARRRCVVHVSDRQRLGSSPLKAAGHFRSHPVCNQNQPRRRLLTNNRESERHRKHSRDVGHPGRRVCSSGLESADPRDIWRLRGRVGGGWGGTADCRHLHSHAGQRTGQIPESDLRPGRAGPGQCAAL